jgi:hypothetical protein
VTSDRRVLDKLRAVALSCQMHGVLCWSSADLSATSPLFTWEDGRCDESLLAEINGLIWRGTHGRGTPVFSGYGAATLLRLTKSAEGRSLLSRFDRCGSIGTYVAACFTAGAGTTCGAPSNLAAVPMHVTDAAAFGCCLAALPPTTPPRAPSAEAVPQVAPADWLPELSRALEPFGLALPPVTCSATRVGSTSSARTAIERLFLDSSSTGDGGPGGSGLHPLLLPPGLPVYASLGDHSAAMAAVSHWASTTASASAALGLPPTSASVVTTGRQTAGATALLVVSVGTSAQAALVPFSSSGGNGSAAGFVAAEPEAGVRWPGALLLLLLQGGGGPLPAGCEVRPCPYPSPSAAAAAAAATADASLMLVGASLSGGNVLAAITAALAPRVRQLLALSPGGSGGGADAAAAPDPADAAPAAADDAVYAFLESEAAKVLAAAAAAAGGGIDFFSPAVSGFDPAPFLLPERCPAGGWPPSAESTSAPPGPLLAAAPVAADPRGRAAAALRAAAAAADARTLGSWYACATDAVVRNTLQRLPAAALLPLASGRGAAAGGGGGCCVAAVVGAGGVLAKSACARALLERAVLPLGAPVLWLPQGVAAYAGAMGAALVARKEG